MTERGLPIADGAPACPFVAFADDRDERATSPDHRHRCYAEPEPAPRALAHQEAYCLASAFPVCPTFQDWARREAARTSGPAMPAGTGAAGAAGAIAGSDAMSQRNPPRDWAAPPPWLGSSGGADADADEVRPIPSRGGGLAGSFADRVASGDQVAPPARPAAAPPVPPSATPRTDETGYAARPTEGYVQGGGAAREAGATAARPATERGESHRDRDAPEWEHPRRLEAYPAIRSRRLAELSISPILIAFVALLLASAVLFALPGLLGFGGPGGGPAATPTAPAAAPTILPSLPPTPVPAPTAQVYIVQEGDTMSRIANRFGIPLQDLIDANAANIPDPNRLQIGDAVIIPAALPTEIPAEVPAST